MLGDIRFGDGQDPPALRDELGIASVVARPRCLAGVMSEAVGLETEHHVGIGVVEIPAPATWEPHFELRDRPRQTVLTEKPKQLALEHACGQRLAISTLCNEAPQEDGAPPALGAETVESSCQV